MPTACARELVAPGQAAAAAAREKHTCWPTQAVAFPDECFARNKQHHTFGQAVVGDFQAAGAVVLCGIWAPQAANDLWRGKVIADGCSANVQASTRDCKTSCLQAGS